MCMWPKRGDPTNHWCPCGLPVKDPAKRASKEDDPIWGKLNPTWVWKRTPLFESSNFEATPVLVGLKRTTLWVCLCLRLTFFVWLLLENQKERLLFLFGGSLKKTHPFGPCPISETNVQIHGSLKALLPTSALAAGCAFTRLSGSNLRPAKNGAKGRDEEFSPRQKTKVTVLQEGSFQACPSMQEGPPLNHVGPSGGAPSHAHMLGLRGSQQAPKRKNTPSGLVPETSADKLSAGSALSVSFPALILTIQSARKMKGIPLDPCSKPNKLQKTKNRRLPHTQTKGLKPNGQRASKQTEEQVACHAEGAGDHQTQRQNAPRDPPAPLSWRLLPTKKPEGIGVEEAK